MLGFLSEQLFLHHLAAQTVLRLQFHLLESEEIRQLFPVAHHFRRLTPVQKHL